jgi:hypothetical protein
MIAYNEVNDDATLQAFQDQYRGRGLPDVLVSRCCAEAWDRGHSAGCAEVAMILQGMMYELFRMSPDDRGGPDLRELATEPPTAPRLSTLELTTVAAELLSVQSSHIEDYAHILPPKMSEARRRAFQRHLDDVRECLVDKALRLKAYADAIRKGAGP